MLDVLGRVFDDGGCLMSVSATLFEGDRSFITAFALRFEHLTVVFRVVPNDDTLAVAIGSLVVEPSEIVEEVEGSRPWSECIGLSVSWAWRLTNQQGYSDGVRLEFGKPGEQSSVVLELVVAASTIQFFLVLPQGLLLN